MKIKTQLSLMVLGVVILPILVSAGLLWVQRTRDQPLYSVPNYEEISATAGDAIRRDEWERLAVFLERRKSDTDFFVLREDGRIIYSTDPQAFPEPVVSPETLLAVIRATSDRAVYHFDAPLSLERKGVLLIMRLARKSKPPPSPLERFAPYLALVLGAIFAFSAAMTVIIAKSISRSVTALDTATRRIAAGELDTAVEAQGSNEITSLAASLNRMRLALKDENIRQARFVMGVSHDLKTPLALIKGYTELIRDGIANDAASMERSLGIIATKVDQLEGMIDDLMDFVKMDTGEWRWKLEPLRLLPILEDYGKRATLDAEFLNRRFCYSLDIAKELTVKMDERLFLRALENLVGNALRYSAEGGTVLLSATVEDGAAVLRITDNGPGIAPDDLPHIFEPFYRGSSSRREPGFGLGLSIVKGVIDSHGWEISVQAHPDSGSEFVIRMPLGQ